MKIKIIALLSIITALAAFSPKAGLNIIEGAQTPKYVAEIWGEESEGFQLSARLEKQEVSIGEAIRLKLTIRNTADKERPLTETYPEDEYKLEIKNKSGERPPLTEAGQLIRTNEGTYTSITGLRFAPGQEQQSTIRVDTLYDLTVPGIYLITARRGVSKLDNIKAGAEVVSNTVTLIVREGFQLSARLEKQEVKFGEPVLLHLTLKNMTQDYLPLAHTIPHGEYKLDITIQEGKNPPLTKFGQSLQQKEAAGNSGSGLVLAPGQEQQEVVRVDQMYDLSVPGAYFITASRTIGKPDHKSWGEVVSNTVTLIVTY